MPRTPLMHLLQRAIRRARRERATQIGRRSFLKNSVIAAAGLSAPLLPSCSRPRSSLPTHQPSIIIIGAGLAGLCAADTLRKAGVSCTVYEASNRTGGRILTARNNLFPNAVTELGAELIDSDDTELHSLIREFGLELTDLHSSHSSNLATTFYFEGKVYREADIVREISPVLDHVSSELQQLQFDDAHQRETMRATIDAMSIESYFVHLGLTGWLRAFLETAFVAENGLELGDQSALNFLTTVGLDVSDGTFSVYGSSDERYTIKGGNDQLIGHLTERNQRNIHTSHVLEMVQQMGSAYSVTLRHGERVFDVRADYLILALPFTILRNIPLRTNLPKRVQDMISNLSYGENAKVMVGFKEQFWSKHNANGVLYTDLPAQLVWPNTTNQDVRGGGLTFFSGGATCRMLGRMHRESCASFLINELSKVWPEAATSASGRILRMHWPSMPWIRSSYSSFGPGQWTRYSGVLSSGFHNNTLYFAGEHCSDTDRGFMNGAAATGRQAAENVLAAIV